MEWNGQWELGLSSITLPDTYLEMSILKDMNTFELKTVRNYIGINVEVPKNNTTILTVTCAIKLLRGAFPGIKNFMLHVKYDDISIIFTSTKMKNKGISVRNAIGDSKVSTKPLIT